MIPAQADSLPSDTLGRRLLWGLLVSLPVNLAVWGLASGVVRRPTSAPSTPILVRRIILTQPKVTPKPRPKKIVRNMPRPKTPLRPVPQQPRRVVLHRPLPRYALMPKTAPPTRTMPEVVARPRPVTPRYAPPTANPRILPTRGATPAANTAPPDGDAPPGLPTEPSTPTAPTAPRSDVKPDIRPANTAPTVAPASSAHEDTPPATGPTRGAKALSQDKPEIPDELREDDYHSSVRASIQIDAEGQVTDVTLLGTTGSRELDRRAVDAWKRWRWQPALRDGKAVPDTRFVRFDFSVP